MRQIRSVKQWTDSFSKVDNLVEELQVIYEFSEAGEATEEEVEAHFTEAREAVEDLETRNMLRREEDRLGALLKINAGAGGNCRQLSKLPELPRFSDPGCDQLPKTRHQPVHFHARPQGKRAAE